MEGVKRRAHPGQYDSWNLPRCSLAASACSGFVTSSRAASVFFESLGLVQNVTIDIALQPQQIIKQCTSFAAKRWYHTRAAPIRLAVIAQGGQGNSAFSKGTKSAVLRNDLRMSSRNRGGALHETAPSTRASGV